MFCEFDNKGSKLFDLGSAIISEALLFINNGIILLQLNLHTMKSNGWMI
jgi:hypothetical protein